MKKDIQYMGVRIRQLKREYSSRMHNRFGKVVNIGELELAMLNKTFQKTYVNELEEVALKKMVYDLRIKMTDVKGHFAQIFNLWNVGWYIFSCWMESYLKHIIRW